MRFAINPLQWDLLDPDGVGSTARRHSPQALAEVRAAGFTAVPGEPELLGGAAACRELLAANGLEPAPGYFSAPLRSGRLGAAERERAVAFAAAQAELGLSEACLADDLDRARIRQPQPPRSQSAAVPARIAEAVADVTALWAEVGLTPCLHSHVGTGLQTETELEAVLEATEVPLCPDTGHLAWAGIEPVDFLRRHRGRVRMLHVKDLSSAVAAQGEARVWDYGTTVKAGLWREPGFGDLDLTAALDAVAAAPSWVIVEVDHSTVAPAQSARRCRQWVSEIETRKGE